MRKSKILIACLMLLHIGHARAQFDGFALYNEQNNNTAYLIDSDGNIAHSWSCALSCNYALELKDNGNIVRGAVNTSNQLSGAAVGGTIQEIDPNGNVVWTFDYSDASTVQHHDITVMPNGNVLFIAWEVKSITELDSAGVDNATADKWPTVIVEIEPTGNTAQVVWEWHMWDHLIQDHDSSKANYGVVADHPELMDMNAVTGKSGPNPGGDWFHVNGLDYNDSLDQIVFSSRYASEIYIIDHSTTTAEAAGHTGGNSGKGGDFLFRWGNPGNYGSPDPQQIPEAVHDPRWVKEGRPNAGYIQFFNNEGAGSNLSVVDAINPTRSGYNYPIYGTSWGPTMEEFRHNCITHSTGQSASDRMSNGNVFVAVSREYMYEVDSTNNLVWQYNAGPAKAFRYESDHPGILALLGDPVDVSINEVVPTSLSVYPNPSNGIVNIDGIASQNNEVVVRSASGTLVAQEQNVKQLNLSGHPAGVYLVTVSENGLSPYTVRLLLQ